MEKERVWIFAIVFAITIGVCVMLRYQQIKTGSISQSHKESENVTEAVIESDENVLTEESREYFKNARSLTIEKVERTVMEDDEGNVTTSYDTYYVSDVDCVNQSDQTEDYTKALAGEEFDETLIETVEFQKAFEVNYKNVDGWTVYENLLLKNGIDGDLEEITFDTETNQMTGQKLYVLEQPCSATDWMLQENHNDEVLGQKVFYQTMETSDGIVIPDYFSAVVQYKAGNQKITKSLYLQVTVNNWEEESHEVD